MTLRRHTDTTSPVRFRTQDTDTVIRFDDGRRLTDEYDSETEQWAAETFDEVTIVDEVEAEEEAEYEREVTSEEEDVEPEVEADVEPDVEPEVDEVEHEEDFYDTEE